MKVCYKTRKKRNIAHLLNELKRDYPRDGKLQAGLFAAWDLVGELTDGAAAEFIRQSRPQLMDRIKLRNNSILAHGFQFIGRQEWEQFGRWFKDRFYPVLEAEAQGAGIQTSPQQLPDEFPLLDN